MMNNKDMSSQFNRMKDLMNYGLNEGKKQAYSGVEYTREGADNKVYGIVREGLKYYIKVAKDKNNLIAENFEYIGGFRNRKDHEYNSFASAQKNFDFKMRSLAEAYGNDKKVIIESWNPDKNESLSLESYDKMRKEIMRERQIMENASKISNGKAQSLNECDGKKCSTDPFCENPDDEFAKTQKDTLKGKVDNETPKVKKLKAKKGTAAGANKGFETVDLQEASEKVLGWNREDPDYMDKSRGTKRGSDTPFDDEEARNIDDNKQPVTQTGEMRNGVVKEATSMHDNDNQNNPDPGVGEGPSNEHNKPFNGKLGKQLDDVISEAIDDLKADAGLEDGEDVDLDGGEGDAADFELEMGDDDGLDDSELGDDDLDDSELGDDDLEDSELGDDDLEDSELGDDFEESDNERLDSIEDKLTKIMDKLGVSNYDDEPLYDDDDFGGEDDEEIDDEEDENVYETRAYRAMKLNEEGMKPFKDAGRVPSGNILPLKDFGKHPAYQKKVMTLPPKDFQEFPDYYDMNDESVRNDSPYGEKIGDSAPFDLTVDKITNSIAESIMRVFGKKK